MRAKMGVRMSCDDCHIRPATAKVQIHSGGTAIERRLCQLCAQKYTLLQMQGTLLPAMVPFLAPSHAPVPVVPACPRCGYSLHQFQQSSLLGCDACYQAFTSVIQRVLTASQGGLVKHAGKVPSRRGGDLQRERELAEHQKALETAVREERYEDAARLRDQIRALKEELAHEE